MSEKSVQMSQSAQKSFVFHSARSLKVLALGIEKELIHHRVWWRMVERKNIETK